MWGGNKGKGGVGVGHLIKSLDGTGENDSNGHLQAGSEELRKRRENEGGVPQKKVHSRVLEISLQGLRGVRWSIGEIYLGSLAQKPEK